MYKPTGTNVTPLGTKRRFVEAPSEKQEDYKEKSTQSESPSTPNSSASDLTPKRKRKSRWGDEQKIIIPGLPTAVNKLDKQQSEKYLLQIRLEEINRKLRTGDYLPSENRRSPSPEPVYDANGKRVNTREARYKKKLEDERHKLIEIALKTIPNFRPPIDYKRPTKLQEKVYIPSKEFPDINFIGQLIGPRGNTLKGMEADSGAKISIRGRGSVKEGKSRTDAASNAAQEEDLHCLVTADSEDKVKKAVKLIEKVIETSASVPEGQNELKRNQLRELAALNGTLRDDEAQTCLNCGGTGHRRYECPERQNITSTLSCHICGGMGHISRDCTQRNNPEFANQANERDAQLDSEYMNLMAELGENVPEGGINRPGAAPWQRAGGTAPPWQQRPPVAPDAASGAASAPWAAAQSTPAPPGVNDPAQSAPWQSTGGYPGYNAPPVPGGYYNAYGTEGYGAYPGYYDASQAPPPPGGSAPWQPAAPPPPPGENWGVPPPPSEPAPPPPPSSDPVPPPPPSS
jgi:splicing factor 1